MVDTPITNCYFATVEALEAYFASDPRAAAFLALSDDTKAWYAKAATKAIDRMYLKGTTYDTYNPNAATLDDDEQALMFPRVIDGYTHDWDEDGEEAIIPQAVKDACAEEALAIYKLNADADALNRQDLQSQGVTSISLAGQVSETYQKGAAKRYKGLNSKEAFECMKPYIAGACEVRFG